MKKINTEPVAYSIGIHIVSVILIISFATTSFAQISNLPNQEPIPNPIFITHRADNNVLKLPSEKIWPAGRDMTYTDATEDGKVVVATSSGENQVFVFNGTNSSTINKIKVGDSPTGIKISTDKKYVLVANQVPGTVRVIDLENMQSVG